MKSTEPIKKDIKDNANNCTNNSNKKEKEENNINIINIENIDNLGKKNISPLISKFRNFYSLIKNYEYNTVAIGNNNKKNENSNNNNCRILKNRVNDENSNNNNINNNNNNKTFLNIKRVELPLNIKDINCKVNDINKIFNRENKNDSLLYLKTTNGIKSILLFIKKCIN